MLKGELPLPWEGGLSRRQVGPFREPLLKLLHRDPAQRADMASFHHACTRLFTEQPSVTA